MNNRVSCPFVRWPFEDCYVSSMSSSSIDAVVYYCGANFKECQIYKRSTEPVEDESHEPEEGLRPLLM